MKLILASTSPRRQEILNLAGLTFTTVSSDFEEDMSVTMAPDELVRTFSAGKAGAVAGKNPDAAVLGADTVVALGDTVFGKPADRDDAARMLRLLSGQTHSVWTGFTWICNDGGICYSEQVESRIMFRNLSDDDIMNYIETGEPLDKAGAYGIQGLGGGFVQETWGDYLNIVGLPLKEVLASARRLQIWQ
jgi:septum formation protein